MKFFVQWAAFGALKAWKFNILVEKEVQRGNALCLTLFSSDTFPESKAVLPRDWNTKWLLPLKGPIVYCVFSNPLNHKIRYAQQHSILNANSKWAWAGPGKEEEGMLRSKGGRQMQVFYLPLYSSFHHFQLFSLEWSGCLLGWGKRRHQQQIREGMRIEV